MGLAVRFMGIDRKGITSYLISLYCALAVVTDDALGVLDNVDVTKYPPTATRMPDLPDPAWVGAPDEALIARMANAMFRAATQSIAGLLRMNEMESLQPGPGREFIVGRLMELILVEILRSEELRVNQEQKGLLAGLADPVTVHALSDAQRYRARLDCLRSRPTVRRLAIHLCRSISHSTPR